MDGDLRNTYTYIHTYIHTYAHTNKQTHTCIYIYTKTHKQKYRGRVASRVRGYLARRESRQTRPRCVGDLVINVVAAIRVGGDDDREKIEEIRVGSPCLGFRV